jgi:hypothetical protein
MAGAIDRMLVAGRVLRDPFGAGAVPEHSGDDTTVFLTEIGGSPQLLTKAREMGAQQAVGGHSLSPPNPSALAVEAFAGRVVAS